MTPVACAEIATGTGAEQHWISGMNWYHRLERRYVEYGSSLEATRAFGVFRALYDLVYNMNLAHLSPNVETIFESLDDAGLRTASTSFLIYRGRHRHQVSPRRPAAPGGRSNPAQVPPRDLGAGRSSSTASSTRAGPFPARRRRSPAAATSMRRAAPRSCRRPASTTSCSSRCPTTTPTRTATGRRRPSTRSSAPTRPSRSSSRRPVASTASSPITR